MRWEQSKIIELRLRELNQLFNSMDPSPFREKDLDQDAEEFIVASAIDAERWQPLVLIIHIDKLPTEGMEAAQKVVTDAVQNFFAYEELQQKRKFRELMSLGRWSLVIGLIFLAVCITVSRLIGSVGPQSIFAIIQESLFIVGWVAMWRPLEIFLYEWWPIVRLRRLYSRMSKIEVQVKLTAVGRSSTT